MSTTLFSKTARKAVTAGLALTMSLAGVMGAAAPALAATGADAATIATISASNLAKAGKYNVYQIMIGSVTDSGSATEGGIPGKMGDAVVNTDNYATVKATIDSFNTANGLTAVTWNESSTADKANSMMDAIAAIQTAGKSQAFANALAAALETSGTTIKSGTASSGSLSFADLKTGYYLICSDSDDAGLAKGESMTSAILTTLDADGTAITGKVKAPTVEKNVKNGSETAFDGAADASLVDGALTSTTYQIVGTLPANIAEYDTYKYAFVDALPTGMTTTKADVDANWSVSIKMYADGDTTKTGTDVTSSFASSVAAGSNSNSVITWSCADVTALTGFNADTKFVVEYTPVLSDSTKTTFFDSLATLAGAESNSVHVTYTNNPYTQGDGTTTDTPDDETKLYSYNLVVNKVDDKAGALKGAAFTLTNADGKTIGKDITAYDTTNGNSTFNFTGLESGVEYTLTETTVPTGKKAISPIKFTISATESDGAITAITPTESSDPSSAATLTVSDATVTATVVNLPGVNMPGTGQAGIAVAVVVGGVLLAVSAVAKSRQGGSDEE